MKLNKEEILTLCEPYTFLGVQVLIHQWQRESYEKAKELVNNILPIISKENENADGNQLELLVILRPLALDYVQKKEKYYNYGYSKECDADILDQLNISVDDAEAKLLKKLIELVGAV